MKQHKSFKFLCYAILPIASLTLVLGLAWFITGLLEFYTNNLTTLRTLDHFTKYSDVSLVPSPPFPDDKLQHCFTFLQISDIHISKFRDYEQVHDLKLFCNGKLFQDINPSLVIITGDLTDAKDESLTGSEQYVEEWLTYSELMEYCRKKAPATQWLDIKGNHDAFKVKSIDDDYYDKYGHESHNNNKDRTGVTHYVHQLSYGSYEFIGVDLTPHPGPGRPFNFFGVPRKETMDYLYKLSSTHRHHHNGTIWYGHYPLSVTTMPHQLRNLLSTGVAYICGHLHTLLELVPQMHAVHSDGFLELELGDWKESRRFRINVFDHDIFSFIDIKYPLISPVVLFTNPTDARYLIPFKNPTMKAKNSTHIRFFVYWTTKITDVKVYIDNKLLCNVMQFDGNLYTCSWNPSLYLEGVRKLSVELLDSTEKKYTSSINFSLDGTRTPLSFVSVVLLYLDFITVLKTIYILAVTMTTVFLYVLKFYSSRLFFIGLLRDFLRYIIPQLDAVLECDRVFWPLFYYNCYTAVGPLSVGYFLPDDIGIAFPFGIYSDGYFVNGSLTYLYVAEQLLVYNLTVILYIGERLITTSSAITCRTIFYSKKLRERFKAIIFQMLLCFFIFYQISHMKTYLKAYGLMSVIVNPLKTWSLPLFAYLMKKL